MRLLQIGIILALATASWADVITLKSGRVINGTYLGGSARELKVQIADQIETFDVSQVSKVEFGNGAAAASTSDDRPVLRRAQGSHSDDDRPTIRRDTAPPVDDSRPTLRRDSASNDDVTFRREGPTIVRPGSEPSANSTAGTVSQRGSVEIPAGTNLVVRMVDGVDSDRDSVGKTFQASIDQPITVGGDVIIQRGADVVVKLVDSHDAGKVSGRADLTLALVSVKVDGRIVDINTQSVTRESEGRGKSTATKAGGGAVAGAILGAVLGGGKGAAVGAAAGGAAGVGVEAATKGPHVKVPSETRLTFILDNPITI
jgi:hypothetical protein